MIALVVTWEHRKIISSISENIHGGERGEEEGGYIYMLTHTHLRRESYISSKWITVIAVLITRYEVLMHLSTSNSFNFPASCTSHLDWKASKKVLSKLYHLFARN